jgi:PAS domain S-box-containing protein
LIDPASVEWTVEDWRLIAESIPHLVWVSDEQGRTLFFNDRAVSYGEVSRESVDSAAMVHPDDRVRGGAAWAVARRTGTGFEEDLRLRRGDGEYRWHSVQSQPVHRAGGSSVRWFGTATDVEERKQAESRLLVAQGEALETVELLSELQTAAPVAIGWADRDLRMLRANDELGRLFGQPAADVLGRTIAAVQPDLWSELEPIYRHVLGTGEAVRNLPITRPPPDEAGPHREWLATFYPVRVGGRIEGVGLIAVDITERLQAEGFRSTVMSQLTDGVYTQDCDGLLTYMNRAASRMLGWTEAELCGRNVHDVVHVPRVGREPIAAADCALLREGPDRRLARVSSEAFTRKDGTTFPIAYSSMPLLVGSRVDGVSVVFRNVEGPGASPPRVRLLIAAADPNERDALTAALTRHEELVVIGVATDSTAAIEHTARLHPDVVLVDIDLPEIGGPATTVRIKADTPSSAVIMLALDIDDAVAAGAIAAGCSGIVDKRRTWVDLADAVRAAYHGETSLSQVELQQVLATVRQASRPGRAEDLTNREREVLRCLTRGQNNQQAATELGMKVNTVRNHVQHILYKLDVHSRLEAVVLATQGGLLDDPS